MQESSSLAEQIARLVVEAGDPYEAIMQLLLDLCTSLHEVAEQRDDDLVSRLRCLVHELERFTQRLNEPERPRRTLREEVDLLRQRVVRDALLASKNNVSGAARSLGVSRNLIYDVLKQSKKEP